MANYYINAFYDPTTTAVISVYACPSNSRAIIQNIQVTNESGSKILKPQNPAWEIYVYSVI